MACSTKGWQITTLPARLSAGLARLSSQRAFVTGLVIGASGTGLGAVLLAQRQRLARLFQRGSRSQPALVVAGPPLKNEAKPSPGLTPGRTRPAKPIPGLAVEPTQLQAAAVPLQTRTGSSLTAEDSYRVVRADGTETGLALTPYLEQDEAGQPVLKPDTWSVTHTGSGALLDGPYDRLEQAHALATKLSALPWTRPVLTPAERQTAQQLIRTHRQHLAGESR